MDWSRLAQEFGVEHPGPHTRVLDIVNDVRRREGLPLVAARQPTLPEAGDRVRITEVGEEGSVPNLKVGSLGALPLLLLDGEHLVGAQQNRILIMTVLVAAQTEVTVPVSCVEQARWGYRARHSAPSDSSLYAGLRAKKSAWVSRSLREGRRHTADQLGVWEGLP